MEAKQMSTLADLKKELAEFNDQFRGKNVQALGLLGPFDLDPIVNEEVNWDEKFGSNRPGVYCFFDKAGKTYYVGKASEGSVLGNRVRGHIRWGKKHGSWIPRTLVTIPVDHELRFVAPGLEEFLIMRLDPYGNTRGRPSDRMKT